MEELHVCVRFNATSCLTTQGPLWISFFNCSFMVPRERKDIQNDDKNSFPVVEWVLLFIVSVVISNKGHMHIFLLEKNSSNFNKPPLILGKISSLS